MKIIKSDGKTQLSVSTQEIEPKDMKSLNETSLRIINILKKEPMYPKQIANHLRIHEQNIYYHIRKLEKSGIIKISEQKRVQGIMAKVYALSSDSFFFKFSDFRECQKVVERESKFFKQFLKNGELDATIVVGSPDPHGPQKARSRDGYFGIDLALFLGSFITNISETKVKLDIEMTEKDLRENLIVIGGPIVNKISASLNRKMPIFFDDKKGLHSSLTKKYYGDENIGVINRFKNPYNKEKEIIFVAGIKYFGTKAAILAFLKHFEEIEKGNRSNKNFMCKVVEGIDRDFDGIVDDAEFLE